MTDKNHDTQQAWQQAIAFFEDNFHIELQSLTTNTEFLALSQEVRSVVMKLYQNKQSNHTILDQPAINKYSAVMEQDLSNEIIGSYQLIELIAHGGMSSVYRARRIDIEAQKDVAIKLIPGNLQTSETTTLFRQEMDTLSQLHHPNIISMHHGDVSSTGIPYLVMELIEDAQQIDHYLLAAQSKHQMTEKGNVKTIVAQFVTLCQVIGYAHQNNIIHQDIKPSNVLIDPHGHLLVLDFGVAALAETIPDHHAYTLSYAPPEQTKNKPNPNPSFDTFAITSLLIKCLSQAADDQTGWQHQALQELSIDADLRYILNKGLSNSTDRYQTCSDLVLDLQLWQKDLPISEFKNKPLYRFKKTIMRHPIGSALTAATLLVMTMGLIFYQQQYQMASIESQKAQQVKNILIDAIEQNDPDISKGNDFTVRDMLAQVQLSISENPINDHHTATEVLMTLGTAFNKLGDYQSAIENIEKALSIQADNNEALFELAELKLSQKYNDEAKQILNQLKKLTLNASPSTQLKYHLLSAKYHVNNSEFELADQQFANAQQLTKQINDPVITINYLAALADGKFEQDDIGSSIQAINSAVELSELHYGVMHSKTLRMKAISAETHLSSSSEDVLAAIEIYQQLIPQQQQLLGNNHPAVAKSLFLKSTALRTMNQPQAARDHAEQALLIAEEQFGRDHIFTGKILMSLGAVYLAEGDVEKAIEYASIAVAAYEHHFGPEHHETLQYKTSYVSMLGKNKQHKKALELLLEIQPIQSNKLGPNHRATLFVDVVLSRTYTALNEIDQAITVGERCLNNAKNNSGRNMMEVYCAFVLENAYFLDKQYAPAAALIAAYIDDPLIANQPTVKAQFTEHQQAIEAMNLKTN